MIHDLYLEPLGAGRPVRVVWDDVTGDLSGDGNKLVLLLIDEALHAGEVVSHPYPTVYPVTDPLHSLPDMAVVLSSHWRLPPEMAEHMPDPPEDESSDIPLVY